MYVIRIKMRFILIFLILLSNSCALDTGLEAVPKTLSRATFAIQHSKYDCDGLIHSLKDVNNFNYSWLYKTFDNVANGKNVDCINKLNALTKTKMMQVHLINETCQRDNDCSDYEFTSKLSINDYQKALIENDKVLINKLEDYLIEAKNVILPTLRQDMECFISPGLESNLNQKAAKKLIFITRKHFGKRCKLVWNPVGNNKFTGTISDTVHEIHGYKAKLKSPCIANLDGVDIKFDKIQSLNDSINSTKLKSYLDSYKHCEAAFLWTHQDNCLNVNKFIDPRKRTKCADAKLQKKIIEAIK